MAIERTYNVPLRKEWLKVPKYKRARKAVDALRAFLQRHMKSEEVKIGKFLNEAVWQHGMRNPPHHIKVNVKKDDAGKVFAELVGAPTESVEKKVEKEIAKPAEAKAAEMVEEKKPAVKEIKPAVTEKPKEIKKEEKPAAEKKEEKELHPESKGKKKPKAKEPKKEPQKLGKLEVKRGKFELKKKG